MPKISPPPQLEDRIKRLREEIDAFIDALAERESGYGIPVGVIRNSLTARSGGCECRAYLQLKDSK